MSERPIDILKCTFMPQLWHKTPYLVCILKLKNDTSIGKYLFPNTAKLEISGELVAFGTPTFESPGSHTSGSGASCEGGGITTDDFYWNTETRRDVYCCFEVGAMVMNSLARTFETKDTDRYRIELELVEVHIATASEIRFNDRIVAYVEGQLKAPEWQEWMQRWGVASEAIYIPTEIANELRKIKPTMRVGFEWEVIIELLKSYQGSEAESILVTSEAELNLKMTQVIEGAEKQLLIMCRAFDETFLTPIVEAQGRGVAVKIVTVPTEKLKQEKHSDDISSRMGQALKKLSSSKIPAKKNVSQHARVIVSEKAALVGSTDPDYFGLKIHKNASIYTTNATVVNAALLFFHRIWQESEV